MNLGELIPKNQKSFEKIKNYLLGVLDQNQIQFQIGDLQFQLNIEELFDKLWPNMRQIVSQTQMRAKTGGGFLYQFDQLVETRSGFKRLKVNGGQLPKIALSINLDTDETEAHYGQLRQAPGKRNIQLEKIKLLAFEIR